MRLPVLIAAACWAQVALAAPILVLDEATFRDKVYACWLGKSIGGTLGLPVEGQRQTHNFTFYTPVPTEPGANDDLDLQLLWLKALEEQGPRLDERVLGEYWLDYVPVDWNEYGIGKANQRLGFVPPLSGQVANRWKDSNGAWIRSEIWACLAPGCPDVAARYAWMDACVDHGAAEGTWAEVFTATLESAAFVESDREKLLDIALSYIPSNCAVAESVQAVRQAHADGASWAAARENVVEVSAGTGWFMAPQNVAFVVLGWLYGGEFGDSLCAAVNCGDDTDCTGATLGSLLGILGGSAAIPAPWRVPVGEGIRNVAISGFEPPRDLQELTDRTVAMAHRVLAEHGGRVAIGRPAGNAADLALTNEAVARDLWDRSPYRVKAATVAFDAELDLGAEPVVAAGDEWPVTVSLHSRSPHDLRVEVVWQGSDSLSVPPESAVNLAAGQRVDIHARLRSAPGARGGHAGRVTLKADGRNEAATLPLAVLVRRAGLPGNLAREAAVKVTCDSVYDREPDSLGHVNDGLFADDSNFEAARWHSALTPHPHWVQLELPQERSIGRVVVTFADPLGIPVSFAGEVSKDGQAWTTVFEETAWTDRGGYGKSFAPVRGRFFRLTIRASANPNYPDAAQLSEIELLEG